MKRSLLVWGMAIAATLLGSSANAVTYTGNIMSGAQFDTYTVFLNRGDLLRVTLVCDAIQGGSRPLDPVLSVFDPFVPPTDTTLATFYNDDGFGLDDDPAGVDCDAFDSSRIVERAPLGGTYTIRADGFGSSTGPYTLNVEVEPGHNGIPTLGESGLLLLGLLLAGFAARQLRQKA